MSSPAVKTEAPPALAINSLKIGAFRGLKDLELDHLARVNLLVGKNNCGKTSVLEALYVMSNPTDIITWANATGYREPSGSIIESIRWLFPNDSEKSLPIELEAFGRIGRFNATAKCTEIRGIPSEEYRLSEPSNEFGDENSAVNQPYEDHGWLLELDASQDATRTRLQRSFPLWSRSGIARFRPRLPIGDILDVVYLPPYGHRNANDTLARFTLASIYGYKSQIISLLQLIDDSIVDMETLTTGDGAKPILYARCKKNNLIPFHTLGDGLRHALSCALAVGAARNSLLLIDEIEAAFHTSILKTVFPWLVQACESFNVQLFATTHSLEAISAIASIDDADYLRKIAAFRLNGDTDAPKPPKRYTGDMLHRLVHEEGLDIR